MDLSKIAFNLIIILVPGIISTLLIKNLTTTKDWNSFKFSIYTILFSGLNYLILQIVLAGYFRVISCFRKSNYEVIQLKVWDNFSKEGNIPYDEVLGACIISIFIGLFAVLFIEKKWLQKIAQKFNISYKYGEENLFYYFLRNKDINDAYVKDFSNNIIYHGKIQNYSDSELLRELVLTDVDIYSLDESKYYYSTPLIYLSGNINEQWVIELPNTSKNKKNGKKNKSTKT